MAWEVFKHVRKRGNSRPMITVLKCGRISMNKHCLEKYFKGYAYLNLMYDRKEHKVGLKPVTQDNMMAGTRVIRREKKPKTHAAISAVAFLRFMEIEYNVTRQYACEWNDEEALLEFQLEEHMMSQ